MRDSLKRLVGMALLAAEENAESAELQFAGCAFSAYSKWSASQSFESLVGHVVRSVICKPEESLAVTFSNGESFSVSLLAEDYVGPEALCARFAEGAWVIE